MNITADTLINEVLEKDSGVEKILIAHGLNCLGCPGAETESLKEAAEGHGADLGKLITDIEAFFNDI